MPMDSSAIPESQEYIVKIDKDGVIHKTKRATPSQQRMIYVLEDKLGYQHRNHQNSPIYVAMRMIQRYQERLDKKGRQGNLL